MIERKPEIDAAILYIQRNIYEPISLSNLSKHVGYSPFHFIRLFKAQTGLTPYHYISSFRIQKAKELLLHTNLPIREIAMEVCQQSLGTFTTRFGEKVGVAPSHFRMQQTSVEDQLKSFWDLNQRISIDTAVTTGINVVGSVNSVVPFEGIIFIGLFHKPIPESLPEYGMIRMSLGEFRFSNVKPGIYYLMATTLTWKMNASDILNPTANLRTRHHLPFVVERVQDVDRGLVTLYPPDLNDPPILISLPLLMSRFLSNVE